MSFRVIDKNELFRLVHSGCPINEMAYYFSVSPETIRKHVIIHKFTDYIEINGRYVCIRTNQTELFAQLYLQLNGAKKIGKERHIGPNKVKYILRGYGFEILPSGKWTKVKKHVIEKNFYLPISPYLLEMITGELLGDGCLGIQMKGDKIFPLDLNSKVYSKHLQFLRDLQNNPNIHITPKLVKKFNAAVKYLSQYPTAQFRMHVQLLEKPWVEYQSSVLVREGYTANVYVRNKKIPTLTNDKNTGFDSSSSINLFDLYTRWYPNNKKIIPPNLKITPNVLLHWYIGDGSLGTNNFYLSTQSFTKLEVEKLVELLKRDANIIGWVRETRDGFNLALSLKKDNVERFFNYLDKANPDALKIAKETFPWKFDKNLKYGDFLKSKKN